MGIRDREQEILLKIERRAERLRQANLGWSYEKAYAEALIANPNLYAAYCETRQDAKLRGIRPIVKRQLGSGQE